MKTIYLLTYLLVGTNFVYSQLNYKYALQDTKDHIIVQSLLSENREDQAINFLTSNGYIKVSDTPLGYVHLDNFTDFNNGNSDIIGTLYIESNFDKEDYSTFKVNRAFSIKSSNENGFRSLNKSESIMLKQVLYKVLNPGMLYNMFKIFHDPERNQEIKDKLIIIDERTVKLYNDVKNEYQTFECSNFSNMAPSINEGLIFFGPESKFNWLEFGYYPLELDNGELHVHFYSICYLGKQEDRKNLKRNKFFDYDEFNSTNDLNQIIWQEKRSK